MKFLIKLVKMHFLFHSWGNWETAHKGEITRPGERTILGVFENQRRVCTICGLVQMKNQKVYLMDRS
jgi:hypothetical protein